MTEPLSELSDSQHHAEQERLQAEQREAAQRAQQWRAEGRMRVWWIPHTFVDFLLSAGIKWKPGTRPAEGYIGLPLATPPPPPDAIVVGIFFAADRDAFCVTLVSSQFEPTEVGAMPPPLHQDDARATVAVRIVEVRE